jgi:Holliday junction resolvase-like predicted endonuclease
MPNSNYRKGAELERRVKFILETQGRFVMKAGGSKGGFDLLSVDQGGTVEFVEVKVNKHDFKPAGRIALGKLAETYSSVAMFVCRSAVKRGVLLWFEVSPEGVLVEFHPDLS